MTFPTTETHKALYDALSAQYKQDWPREAILVIARSFALLYGDLPIEPSFRHEWHMPSKQVVLKVYRWGKFRTDLLAAYPYLAELDTWGTDVLRPLVRVSCLTCGLPFQTRNPRKWRMHPACREREIEEDGGWMNERAVGDVREYGDLVEIAQRATRANGRRNHA